MCHFEGFPRNLSLIGVSNMKLHHHQSHGCLDSALETHDNLGDSVLTFADRVLLAS